MAQTTDSYLWLMSFFNLHKCDRHLLFSCALLSSSYEAISVGLGLRVGEPVDFGVWAQRRALVLGQILRRAPRTPAVPPLHSVPRLKLSHGECALQTRPINLLLDQASIKCVLTHRFWISSWQPPQTINTLRFEPHSFF